MPILKVPQIRPGTNGSLTRACIVDHLIGIYSEPYFRELLVIERKRCERLGQSFILVLLDIRSLFRTKPSRALEKQLKRFLEGSTREIDCKGWINHLQTIGIIYVGAEADKRSVVINKLTAAMVSTLGSEMAAQVKISALAFPEDVRGTEDDHPDTRLLYPDRVGDRPVLAALKRTCDIVGSLALITMLSPFFMVIPLLIRLTSKGPALFKQRRVGQFGRVFVCYKFRTMKANNDTSIHQKFMANLIKNNAGAKTSDGKVIYKIENDPRVTPIGRFLRKTSLDELPQLFNVLLGTMSLVGPRPAIPYEVELYDLWHRRRYLEAKPGITCLWQVVGRSFTDFETQARMDISYINKWSFGQDLKLLVKTPISVIASRGAM